MESLGDILKRITARNISTITNGDGAGLRGSEPEGEVCEVCQGAGWVSKRVPVGHPDFGQAFPCRCQQSDDLSGRTAALHRYSNLGPLSRITFDTTKTEGPLPDAAVRRLFERVIDETRSLERQKYQDEPDE